MKVIRRFGLACLMFAICAICIIIDSTIVNADGVEIWEKWAYTQFNSNATLGKKSYGKSGGGSYKGHELFSETKEGNNTYFDLNEHKFGELTSSAQIELIHDLNEAALKKAELNDNDYNESTLDDWYSKLQTKKGVGTKFMNVILENTKPDFVAANKFYKPFSGVIGTIMGIIAVFMMGLLGIVMVSDIAYITLPPVRIFVDDSNSGNHGRGSQMASNKLFSHDALYAVREAEQGQGEGRQALGIYFKRRVFMLIMLGICLLYLVQGQLYTVVGRILDLLSGII